MLSKKQPTFQAVAVSNIDENEQHRNDEQRRSWTPTATKPPLLVAVLCLILALIALLQVASSKTIATRDFAAELAHSVAKRQIIASTQVYTGFQETITGDTITWQPSTVTFPSVTLTYSLTTQTITGTTESLPGYTSYIYETVETVGGTPITASYELETSGGSNVTNYVVFASAVASAAYLDTSTPDDKITVSSTPSQTSVASETGATSSNAYLQQSAPSFTPTTPLTPTAPSTTSTVSTSTHLPSLTLPAIDRVIEGKYTTVKYYIATYLPSILVILLKILWSHVFASTRLIEPFCQLASQNGATSSSSLQADYLSPSISLSSLASLLTLGQPIMLLTTITTALITILAPIAAESMGIRGSAKCTADDGTIRSCAPVWALDMICIRVLQALLALIFVLIMIYTFFSLRRHHTGVHSDPSAIGTVANLLGNREIISELLSIPPNASKKDIKKILAGNRYNLASYPSPTPGNPHDESYGIIKTKNHLPPNSHLYPLPPPSVLSRTSYPHRSTGTFRALVVPALALLALSLTLFALVLAYSLDYNPDPFNNFFSSNTFGPRFIFSSLATLLSHMFQRLEREVRVYTPWRILQSMSTSSCSEEDQARVIERGLPLTPYTSLPSSLCNLQWLLAGLSFVAILGDVLIIAVTGVPYSDAEIYSAYKWSVWLSVSILVLMMVVGTGARLWLWRWKKKDGRAGVPDTILGAARWCLDLGLDRESSKKRGVQRGVEGEAELLMVEDDHAVIEGKLG